MLLLRKVIICGVSRNPRKVSSFIGIITALSAGCMYELSSSVPVELELSEILMIIQMCPKCQYWLLHRGALYSITYCKHHPN